mgnify:CR=1 FL=1
MQSHADDFEKVRDLKTDVSGPLFTGSSSMGGQEPAGADYIVKSIPYHGSNSCAPVLAGLGRAALKRGGMISVDNWLSLFKIIDH